MKTDKEMLEDLKDIKSQANQNKNENVKYLKKDKGLIEHMGSKVIIAEDNRELLKG